MHAQTTTLQPTSTLNQAIDSLDLQLIRLREWQRIHGEHDPVGRIRCAIMDVEALGRYLRRTGDTTAPLTFGPNDATASMPGDPADRLDEGGSLAVPTCDRCSHMPAYSLTPSGRYLCFDCHRVVGALKKATPIAPVRDSALPLVRTGPGGDFTNDHHLGSVIDHRA